ncbi:MAG: hypothetical protein AAF721_11110 [Myxococcota bacterium]
MRPTSTAAVLLAAALGWSCADDSDPAPAADDTGTSTGGGTFGGTGMFTNGMPDDDGGSTAADETGTTDEGGVDDGIEGECSLWQQDCPDGDKCVPWSDSADLIPDDIRCCPAGGNALHGEECVVEDYFGSCLDDCAAGNMCVDLDGDGMGTCQKFCGGAPNDPDCELNESCFIYFGGVPFCFPKCDPLVQDCSPGNGCYPDSASEGGTDFNCLPTIGGGKIGDPCWLLSSCEPGLLCVTPDFYPGCPDFGGCCSTICDITEPDICDDLVEGTQCVSWYYSGQTPPSVDLQNVGACVLP